MSIPTTELPNELQPLDDNAIIEWVEDTGSHEGEQATDTTLATNNEQANEQESGTLDSNLFTEEPKTESQPEVKALSREQVKENTINNAIDKVTTDDWIIDNDLLAKQPEWVQKEINAQFSTPFKKEEWNSMQELVQKELKAQGDEARFQALLPTIVKDNNLSKVQQEALSSKYKEFRWYGMPKSDALLNASQTLGLWTQDAVKNARQEWFKLWTQKIPPQGQPIQRDNFGSDDWLDNMTSEQIINQMEGRKVFNI